MRAKNLDDADGMQVQDWDTVTAPLASGLGEQEEGGPGRHTFWLTTINADGSPHTTAVGAVWVDGVFWFQTGEVTRKAKNLARDGRCALSVSLQSADITIEGTAEKVTDAKAFVPVVEEWNKGGWPAEVDASGTGITAPFNAPGQGPAPWYVYRITPRSATSCSNVEPYGTTRFTW